MGEKLYVLSFLWSMGTAGVDKDGNLTWDIIDIIPMTNAEVGKAKRAFFDSCTPEVKVAIIKGYERFVVEEF